MRLPLFLQVLPIHLLLLSFFALPLWEQRAAVASAQEAGKTAEADLAYMREIKGKQVAGKATRVVLPRVGVDLAVDDGHYNYSSAAWTVTNRTANYATNTAEPNNNRDKTLLYGHWTPEVFGPTKDLKVNDKAYVYTNNGHILAYKYTHNKVVKPSDVRVFDDLKGDPGLVLLTCQGAWAQERRLMYFSLEAAR